VPILFLRASRIPLKLLSCTIHLLTGFWKRLSSWTQLDLSFARLLYHCSSVVLSCQNSYGYTAIYSDVGNAEPFSLVAFLRSRVSFEHTTDPGMQYACPYSLPLPMHLEELQNHSIDDPARILMSPVCFPWAQLKMCVTFSQSPQTYQE
jgi:hypothetical protein